MGDSINGDGSKGFSSASTQEQGSRNKRKHLSDISLDIPTEVSSLSLTEFPRYELLNEKSRNRESDHGSLESRSDKLKEEEVEVVQPLNWDDPIASQLEDLLSRDLGATFRSAIKKVAECGYTEEVAEWAVLRSGVYYGSKDAVSNIVDGALVYLRKEKEFETTSGNHLFEDLQELVDYTMLELICVLREVKPSLSVVEAMWCLLICDLNLSQMCGVEGDPCGKDSLSDYTLPQFTPEAKSSEAIVSNPNKAYISQPSNTNPQNSLSELRAVWGFPNLPVSKIPHVSEVPFTEIEKSGASKKGCSGNSKRDMLQQKTFHVEKNYKGRMSKGAFKAKLTSWGSLVLDKKLKCPSHSSSTSMKNTSSRVGSSVGANAPQANGNHHLSCNNLPVLPTNHTPDTLPIKDTVPPETIPSPKPQISSPTSPKTPDYYDGIPYDKSLGKYVPQDEKDELVLAVVPRIQGLQKELQGWTDWANEKVMQAARRLSKDQRELKALRHEKEETEKFQKEKQILEDNTMKRLSEMEYALANATGQIEMANSTVVRLEVENSVLKKGLEGARLESLRSASNLQEAVLREQEALKKCQSCEPQKGLLQEELTSWKCKVAELRQEVEKAKGLHNQVEDRGKQEERVKARLLTELGSVRMDRDRLEALAKVEEDMIRQKAENEMKKNKDDIQKLESEIAELRLESESLKIAALRRGISVSYGSVQKDTMFNPALQGHQAPKLPKRLAVFRDNFGAGSVEPERECVMCLTEEMSVVFLPCAHQVLCAKCNVLHENQGMTDCPSCRTPIQKRINVRFANS